MVVLEKLKDHFSRVNIQIDNAIVAGFAGAFSVCALSFNDYQILGACIGTLLSVGLDVLLPEEQKPKHPTP